MTAHQRIIREQEMARYPRAISTLDGAFVAPVDAAWAKAIIMRYEWLGTMPLKPVAFYGLMSADGEPLGVSCFGRGSGTLSRNVCGETFAPRTIVLERGACVHFAHPHAGSFLTSRAVRMCAADHGMVVFLAYSDAEAGEIGTIYQACNWLYLGNSNGRGKSGSRQEGRRKGTDEWINSRRLRNLARNDGYEDTSYWWADARASGLWEFRRVTDRARYVTFAGGAKDVKAARAALRYQPLPYPKRS